MFLQCVIDICVIKVILFYLISEICNDCCIFGYINKKNGGITMLVKRNKNGFTLIELLVVIAIIAILAAILFPVFARAREKARQTTCLSNQRQIAASFAIFAQDHEETFPAAASVWSDIKVDVNVLKCPSAGNAVTNAYVYNNDLSEKAIGKIDDPTKKTVTGDGAHTATVAVPPLPATENNVAYSSADFLYRHSNMVILSFADGHAGITKDTPPPGLGTPELTVKDQLVAFFDAGKGVTTAAGVMTEWANQGTQTAWKATVASGSTGPAVNLTGINGYPSIVFNGSSNVIGVQADIPETTYTEIIAFKTAGNTGAMTAVTDGNAYGAGSHDRQFGTVSGRISSRVWADETISSATTSNDSKPHVACLVVSAPGQRIYLDNTTTPVITGSKTQSDFNWQTYFTIGGHSAWGYYNGEIAEILWYSKVLSDTDRASVMDYLKLKYAIP